MASAKKAPKSKFISDDADVDEFKFLTDSPKPKKTLKRSNNNEPSFEETSIRKKRAESPSDTNTVSRKKILNLVNNQLEARKQSNEKVLKQLAEVTAQVEADYNAMKENEQKLEQLTASYLKCIQQSSNAYKHKLQALQEIQVSFKNECKKLESNHRAETVTVVDDLEYDIKSLQEKLVSETKRSGWESLRRSIFHAMQNDF